MQRNVIEYLTKSVAKYPDKIALKDERASITFSELDRCAKKIAVVLSQKLNGQKNVPVAVYMEKGINCIIAFMGILYSGNYYSPIDVHSPKDRIHLVLQALHPVAVLADESARESMDSALNIDGKDIIFIEEVQTVDASKYDPTEVIGTILDVDPVYVLFTSGSTGVPKGVVINHKAVIDYTEWLSDTFSFDQNIVFGNQAPFYFDNSILDIYQTMRNGATLVVIPERLFMFHSKLIEFMNEMHINTIFWVPSALISVANSGVLERDRLNELEKVLFCGEVMPVKPFNEWKRNYPDVMYANLYGPTEITDVCSYYIVDREFEDTESLPIGKACRNTEIIVLNEENKLVKPGESGELCVRGTCLSLGYYGDFAKSEKVFVQNPLNNRYRDLIYRTGDIVKYNEKDEIIYLCRKDSQIKYQGHRIELGEIDSAGYSIQGIRQACAIYDGSKIIFFCSLTTELTEKQIYTELKNKVPKYMLPKVIRIMEDIPLNVNGKIDRVYLKKMTENMD